MKRLFIRFIKWLWELFFTPKKPIAYKEVEYQKILRDHLGLNDGSTLKIQKNRYHPDLEDDVMVVEVEFSGGQKFYTALGQALTYAGISNKQACIMFIMKKNSKGVFNDLPKYKNVEFILNKHNVKVFYFFEHDKYTGHLTDEHGNTIHENKTIRYT